MNGLAKFDPFAEMRALQKQIFGDDFGNWFSTAKGTHISTTDVYTKNDKELIVEAHLPNFEEKDIDVQIDDGSLVISGDKHEKIEDKEKHYVVRESSASFYRRLRLPENADTNKIKADMENGILKVTMPLKKIAEPKHIQIASKSKK